MPDRPTNRRTHVPSYRDWRTHLKTIYPFIFGVFQKWTLDCKWTVQKLQGPPHIRWRVMNMICQRRHNPSTCGYASGYCAWSYCQFFSIQSPVENIFSLKISYDINLFKTTSGSLPVHFRRLTQLYCGGQLPAIHFILS